MKLSNPFSEKKSSYVSGGNLQSLKKENSFILQEIKLSYIFSKNISVFNFLH